MKPVILAEKPNQARNYAESFKETQKKDGYIEVLPNEIFKEGAIITWGIGHLIELAQPHEYKEEWANRYNMDALPIIPDDKKFIFKVKDNTKEQYSKVERQLKEASYIIVATDIDREGENIAYSIMKQAKVLDKPIKRLFINSLEADVIRKGFQTLKEGKEFYNSYIEAQTRQISDWLIGMNLSRLVTILINDKSVSFSVGRVQTPTLYMVYQREMDIQNFKPKPFYEIEGDVKHLNGVFKVKGNIKVHKKEEALSVLAKRNVILNKPTNSKISKLVEKVEKVSSPKLHTLSSLQMKANKMWKYGTKKTLEIIQSLYEKKIVTYPRTDTPYITENEYEYLLKNVHSYQNIINQPFEVKFTEPQSRYVNTSKVQEHYALIPTKTIPSEATLSKLSVEEKNIYEEIVRNTIAMFHGKYEFNKTIILIDQNGLELTATGKTELSKGWKELYPTDKDDESEVKLPIIKENDDVSLTINIKEGKTTKPKRLTEGDLIGMMANCGKKLEDKEEQEVLKEGLGTEATRANIIETLKNQAYIEVKNNLVHINLKGVILCKALTGTLLSSPSLTAKWETFLSLIGKGERSQTAFLNNIEKFIYKMMEELPALIGSADVAAAIEQKESENHLGECPTCKVGKIVLKKTFYGCTNYSNGCKQSLPKKLLDKNISEKQIEKLLVKGKTDVIKGFKGKSPFDSYLTLEKDEEKNTYKYKFNKK
jgi:DNA topoisomerase-3